MLNIYIHTGIRWEHREYFDVSNMIAFNKYRGNVEDEVYVSMVQDFVLELPDMTEYYYAGGDEPYYINEDDYAKRFRIALPQAIERFNTNPIDGWDLFQHFFYTVSFYPSEENLAKARDYFNRATVAFS